jgi:hypothetical protein
MGKIVRKGTLIKDALTYYTRSTLPDLNALVETQTRLGFPSTRIRTFCKLAPHVRLLAFIACERALPDVVFLPVTTHLRGIMIPSLLPKALYSIYVIV